MKLERFTGQNNYFEDFHEGQFIRHARGKTITEMENLTITHMTLNTAQGHFNADMMAKQGFGLGDDFRDIVVYGGVSFSIVCGLAQQDCCEQAVRELGIHSIALTAPVRYGDTLYAYTKVVGLTEAPQADAGIAVFQHYGVNQKDQLVLELTREIMLRRRPDTTD